MRKNVLIFGLISGAIIAAFMVITISMCYKSNNFDGNMWLGYASMLLAFSFIFVGIKNYRDKYNQGNITFGKAFLMGLYMSLIASTIYVAVWMVDYYLFIPDFMERYADYVIQSMVDEGATDVEIQEQVAKMDEYKEIYRTPVGVALITYMEILPVGLVMSLLAALILKRKPKPAVQA